MVDLKCAHRGHDREGGDAFSPTHADEAVFISHALGMVSGHFDGMRSDRDAVGSASEQEDQEEEKTQPE